MAMPLGELLLCDKGSAEMPQHGREVSQLHCWGTLLSISALCHYRDALSIP